MAGVQIALRDPDRLTVWTISPLSLMTFLAIGHDHALDTYTHPSDRPS